MDDEDDLGEVYNEYNRVPQYILLVAHNLTLNFAYKLEIESIPTANLDSW